MRSVTQSEAALERAKLEVKNAKAQIDEITANIAYLNINSPIHGIVTARTVEPGAVVAAGQTVIALIDLNTVFLRAYVPDGEIGQVRINQRVNVFYDSAPKKEVPGRIVEIDPQASFTPENIYFRDDRVKQVFGVKVQIDNPDNFAKPGMPADADIDVRADSGAKEPEPIRETTKHTLTTRESDGQPVQETLTHSETFKRDGKEPQKRNQPVLRDGQSEGSAPNRQRVQYVDPNAKVNSEPHDYKWSGQGNYSN